jgi:CRISPR-associated protein Cas5t
VNDPLCLFVSVPVCAFRPYASREYQDTYPVPTPASVYGMLLSYLGVKREDKARHRGAELALAVETLPAKSKVFRKLRRGADLENTRPDYQDVLMDLSLWVWVRKGMDRGVPCLADRLREGLRNGGRGITREGGLSLGESSYLVDMVSIKMPPIKLMFIIPDQQGFYSFPTWIDHQHFEKTVVQRFHVHDRAMDVVGNLDKAWFSIPGEPPP